MPALTAAQDGVILNQLLEVLSGKPVGPYMRNPKLRLQVISNLSVGMISFLQVLRQIACLRGYTPSIYLGFQVSSS